MEIDITNNELTYENVRKLIASTDDSVARQIRVTTDGRVFISDDTNPYHLDGILFRLETFGADSDYLGEGASKDSSWVERVLRVLQNNWPHPACSYIDNFDMKGPSEEDL